MRSMTSLTATPLGRLLTITTVSLCLFLGVTGFIPWDEYHQDKRPASQADSFARQYNSITSHNLVVDTSELRCLALNIYWESRSESLNGQLAVAGVTMNRVANKKFPDTICGVVKHSRSARLHRCQFSWYCDGKTDTPKELEAWRNAQQVARLYLAGIYTDPTSNALWYHADYVNPSWAHKMTRTAKIGRHIFYRALVRETAKLNLN
ncbi:cell wall hydrolase [Terasakiella sp. SH-1]|uniref:cell wall hydrolase n=1 Tax=Terasakiella sp. SH-1 TaxID=2560057 RepID=UPI001073C0FB|nr:cell wall hydrolase [Terasakiella sp. SH-1]